MNAALAILFGLASVVPSLQAAEPAVYALDFVETSARVAAVNNAGVIIGQRFLKRPGCSSTNCLAVTQNVVWDGDQVTELFGLPGRELVNLRGINAAGWIVGTVGNERDTHAVIWVPNGTNYTITDLGVLDGTEYTTVVGIDDFNRVVGFSGSRSNPSLGRAFVWSPEDGMQRLIDLGFPSENPLAISRNGTIATPSMWYSLDDPNSVEILPPPPQGFRPPSTYPTVINDQGDQARFLLDTTSQAHPYLFRYRHTTGWQQLAGIFAGNLAPYGIGGINNAGDISATVNGIGLIAYGPNSSAKTIQSKISLAYGGEDAPSGGPINDNGLLISKVFIGRSDRLMRLIDPPVGNGIPIQSDSIQMSGRFIPEPFNPGQCTDKASNLVNAIVTVTNASGQPIRNATVRGRFLDDYYLDEPVIGTTNRRGTVTFTHRGEACVGAIAIFIDDITANGVSLDTTVGELADSIVPKSR